MKLRQIPSRVCRTMMRPIYRWAGRDNITRNRISQRPDMEHIGSHYGGWVIPTTRFDNQSICYCVGCGEDISFDMGLIERFGCDVYAFDPTPRAIAYVQDVASDNPSYHFNPVGLWDKEDILRFYAPRNPAHVSHSLLNLQQTSEYIEVKVKTLRQLMREAEHHRLDLLKLDIEGAEYKVIDSVLRDSIDIDVICIEYDEWLNPLDREYRHRINASVDKLRSAGYAMVSSHGNGNYTFMRNA